MSASAPCRTVGSGVLGGKDLLPGADVNIAIAVAAAEA
jgi:hypothetical protein